MGTWLAGSLGRLCEETAQGDLIATIMHAECYAAWGHPDSKEEISFARAGATPVIQAHARACRYVILRRKFGHLTPCNCQALLKDNARSDQFSGITIPSCMMANVRFPETMREMHHTLTACRAVSYLISNQSDISHGASDMLATVATASSEEEASRCDWTWLHGY